MNKILQNKAELFTLILFISFSTHLFGQRDRNAPKELGFISRLMKIDSSAVAPFKAATAAMDSSNYKLADSLFTIVYQKAPTFDVAIRRLGMGKVELGQKEEGLALCKKAIDIDRSSDNLKACAICLAFPPNNEQPSIADLNEATRLLNEGEHLPGADDFEYKQMFAQIALRMENKGAFTEWSKRLIEKYPDKMESHYYAAMAASWDEEWKEAEKEILLAKEMGFPEADTKRFLDSGVYEKAHETNYTMLFVWIVISWIIGMSLLYILGILLSNYTLRTVEKQIEAGSIQDGNKFRSFYRTLINIAGVYYYVSLPVVLILVIVLVGGIIYGFLMLGHIPIKLVLILAIGGVVTIVGMIRSIFLKIKTTDPGRELKQSEAPQLFSLTKEIANKMNTRPIDEIRITPETELAVYETGTWKEKMKDNGKRILILGTGVLKDFKIEGFKAVIAHEYGHFTHRDTAGGDVALRVRQDMHKYVRTLWVSGQAVWWNLAFQFLRLYNFIFLRISNGCTRLQEILADRVAAETYGAAAFETGLVHVIKRQIEFVKFAKSEIEDARNIKRPFNNLYDLTQPESTSEIEKTVKEILVRETTLDDTHPSPTDRFRYIKGLGRNKAMGDDRSVTELFTDWAAITKEMTTVIEESWKQNPEG